MKTAGAFTFFIFSFICFLFSISFIGCGDNTSSNPVPSTTPGKELLAKSNFAKFTDNLKTLSVEERKIFLEQYLTNNPNSPIIEDNQLACFYWYGKASSVLITGDIQFGWAMPDTMEAIPCGEEKFFYKIYSLPPDARIDYQFKVDDSITTDPRNQFITPSGFGLHSQCAMPLFKTKPIREFRPTIQHGTIDTLFFKSKMTTVQQRKTIIYKPAGYEELSNLPTLYVNDGFKAMEFCSYTNVLDNLIADKKITPVIVIFIEYQESDRDYFLSKTKDYITAICDELIPLVDQNYKTSHLPGNRVIAGISAGAHISLLTAFKRPDKFLNAAGQSTTVTTELLDALTEAAENEKSQKAFRFYFDVGRYDLLSGAVDNETFLYANQNLHKEMQTAGIKHAFNIYNDGHEWANWRERVDEILIYFFSNSQPLGSG
jgi:enterochelin esterase family protein